MIYNDSVSNVQETHTVQEFIAAGTQSKDHYGYNDFSYIEKRNNIEYIVKNVIDDYYDELFELSKETKLADWAVTQYRGNPKKLSNELYGTTRFWHLILRLNGMANVHEFNLESHKLRLIEPIDIENFVSKVYNTEKFPLQTYKNSHENDPEPNIIEKYIYTPNPSRKYNFM